MSEQKYKSRRTFIKRLIISILSLEIAYLLFDFFKPSNDNIENEEWINIGIADDFETEKFYSFSNGNFMFIKE